mgnify:CR=1 FL=1
MLQISQEFAQGGGGISAVLFLGQEGAVTSLSEAATQLFSLCGDVFDLDSDYRVTLKLAPGAEPVAPRALLETGQVHTTWRVHSEAAQADLT